MKTYFGSAGAVALVLALVLFPVSARGQWDVEYNANSLIYPESNGTGWTYETNDTNFQRGFVGNELWMTTMSNPDNSEGWSNTTGHFDFAAGFVMEARLKMVASTGLYERWGGLDLTARSDAGYNMYVEIDTNVVILRSISDLITSYSMDTTDTYHTYRAEAKNNQAKLYVDGVLRLQSAMQSDNPALFYARFGDQGFEGGEGYFDFVRYGPLPEPTTAGLMMFVAWMARPRRGRDRSR